MPSIIISEATNRALDAKAPAGERLDDGTWRIPIDDELMARLNAVRRIGETDDDLIRRVLAFRSAPQEGNKRGAAHRGLR
jgi:hypothetical protein